MSESIHYIHIQPELAPTALVLPRPFRSVLVLESKVSPSWRALISRWLVDAGCLFALAVGPDCSSWDDSIDVANIERFGFGEIPPDQSVMTTWHEEEPLSEVFWFAKANANHPTKELEVTVLLHIAAVPREVELLASYAAA
jgi:hypothetical protein